jgi:hypothetical protein
MALLDDHGDETFPGIDLFQEASAKDLAVRASLLVEYAQQKITALNGKGSSILGRGANTKAVRMEENVQQIFVNLTREVSNHVVKMADAFTPTSDLFVIVQNNLNEIAHRKRKPSGHDSIYDLKEKNYWIKRLQLWANDLKNFDS